MVAEAYCLKCRKMVEIQDPQRVVLKNMTPALTGTCPISGTTVYRFVHRRLDPVYVLTLAIEREKRAREFYLSAAEKTKDIRGREMYTWLASQSLLNADDLEQQLKALEVGHPWVKWEDKTPALVTMEYPKGSSGVTGAYEPSADELAILRAAIKNERKAVEFYRENEKITTDPDGQLAFELLARRKRGHLNLVEAQLEWVKKRLGYFSIEKFVEA